MKQRSMNQRGGGIVLRSQEVPKVHKHPGEERRGNGGERKEGRRGE